MMLETTMSDTLDYAIGAAIPVFATIAAISGVFLGRNQSQDAAIVMVYALIAVVFLTVALGVMTA
jgi:hypothetical protein